MDYNLGEKLKYLRKKRDLTQEQLAELLGISFQAVSKWETNTSTPDISMFPILANFYGVTTDELLGVDITKRDMRVKEYYRESDELYKSWKLAEMVELHRKACAEFPGNLELRYSLAWTLGQAQHVIRTKKENLEEAIDICNMIMANSSDVDLRLKTLSELCYLHHWNGNDKKAEKYADQLPELTQTKRYLIGRLNLKHGEESQSYCRNSIAVYYDAMREVIENLADDTELNPETRIALNKQLLEIQAIIFGEDILFEHFNAMLYCREIAKLYLLDNNIDKALLYLDKAYDHAEKFDTYPDNSEYSSPMMSGCTARPQSVWSQSAIADLNAELTKEKSKANYRALENEPRYIDLVKKVADKLAEQNKK